MCVVNVCTKGFEVLLRRRVKLDAKKYIYTLDDREKLERTFGAREDSAGRKRRVS